MNPYATPTLADVKTVSSPRRYSAFIGGLAGIVFTPLALWIALVSAGGGHGDYNLAKMLFPAQMLSTLLTTSISRFAIGTAFIQYPLAGVVAGSFFRIGIRPGITASITLVVLHGVLVVVAFMFGSKAY